MKRLEGVISCKLYETKRQYPVIKQVVKGMRIVERELNRETGCRYDNKCR